MDFLRILKKFDDVKEIKDYIYDIEKLRYYYRNGYYAEMNEHINNITNKYPSETLVWNSVNTKKPCSATDAYNYAENFLCLIGVTFIVKNISNYRNRLSSAEIAYIEERMETKR